MEGNKPSANDPLLDNNNASANETLLEDHKPSANGPLLDDNNATTSYAVVEDNKPSAFKYIALKWYHSGVLLPS